MPYKTPSKETCIALRDQLRDARANAVKDAEAYDELLFAIERTGCVLTGEVSTLGGKYKGAITNFIADFAKFESSEKCRDCHIPHSQLFDMVTEARNDALHQGAFARHLVNHAAQLAIALEDALSSHAVVISDLMVRNPICAQTWQPISFIRQQMLANSFSYLPVLRDGKWFLVSDLSIATYLRAKTNERKQRLAHTLLDAIESGGLQLLGAICFQADADIDQVIKTFDGHPVLVCHRNDHEELIGILTAFDIL